MSDEMALLAAIRAAPDDDAPRLIYADWLDEHGQPERADFIRVQVLLSRGRQIDPDRVDDFVAHFIREDELQSIFYESISGLASPMRPFAYERGFAVSFSGLFSSRVPDSAGVWTILIFGSNVYRSDDDSNAMRKIVTAYPPRELLLMACRYLRHDEYETALRQRWWDRAITDEEYHAEIAGPPFEMDEREVLSIPDYVLRHVGMQFYEQTSCVVSDSTFGFDPFTLPPVICFDDAAYRLTSDAARLHLDPISDSGLDAPIVGFDSFPET